MGGELAPDIARPGGGPIDQVRRNIVRYHPARTGTALPAQDERFADIGTSLVATTVAAQPTLQKRLPQAAKVARIRAGAGSCRIFLTGRLAPASRTISLADRSPTMLTSAGWYYG